MSELVWFKSSYSDAGGNNCVEVAACDGDGVAIRDSVFPARVLTTNRAALAALVTGAQAWLSVSSH
ncbi:DUF397 domain-containing protein [Streptomyces sp. NPDC085639]|uniref:DUF397 domain-containing protein n=1 Tax=Streptomyces sp. NPDC085639 TaxID=3365734 RepID=UPI0037D5F8D5